MMSAATETPVYLTFPRWASTSTARNRPSRTPPARTSSRRTSPPPYQPLSYSQPSDAYSHLGDPFCVNSIHHSNQQQSWPGRQGQEAIGSTAAADSPTPFWAWKGARPGCGGISGDRSCCLHTFMESIPWVITSVCTIWATDWMMFRWVDVINDFIIMYLGLPG